MKIKKFFRSFAVAFSMYSKIPMPTFKWGSDDMKYHFCFFPWIGSIIGIILYDWYAFAAIYELPEILFIAIPILIPLIITGGFHLDGFMDTIDALSSHESREKKLEILKDPHIGAFSVVGVASYFILYMGCMSQLIRDTSAYYIFCFSFFLSRVLSGLSVMIIRPAKPDGMLSTSLKTAAKKTVSISLLVQGLICIVLMIVISPIYGITAVAAALVAVFYYIRQSYGKFGGVTGDLSGFFVCISELTTAVFLTVVSILT